MRKLLTSTAVLLGLAMPQTVSARDFLAFQSTTPILYRYAACALALDEATAEAQLEKCAGLKQTLQAEADEVLLKFHLADRRKAQINLARGFKEIERDAKRSRELRKTTPRSIVAYLGCMGERVMQTADYRQGVAVDYTEIETDCAEEHVLSVTLVSSEQELERIKTLYRRFARVGRYVDNSSRLGNGIARTSDRGNPRRPGRGLSRASAQFPSYVLMEGSFLNLSRLPADEEVKHD